MIVVGRSDVALAMGVIRRASGYPKDDWRVELASKYLIWAEDEDTYEPLSKYLWVCDFATEYEDYRAEQAAKILGAYEGEGAFDALVSALTKDFGMEMRPSCMKYVWLGFELKGEAVHDFMLDLMQGKYPDYYIRGGAMMLLARTHDPRFVEPIAELAQNHEDPVWRSGAGSALLILGTPDALEVARQVADEDPSERVRWYLNEHLEHLWPK